MKRNTGKTLSSTLTLYRVNHLVAPQETIQVGATDWVKVASWENFETLQQLVGELWEERGDNPSQTKGLIAKGELERLFWLLATASYQNTRKVKSKEEWDEEVYRTMDLFNELIFYFDFHRHALIFNA